MTTCCHNETVMPCVVKEHPYLYVLTRVWQNFSFRISKLLSLSITFCPHIQLIFETDT